ncbi:MAG TPA: dispase autolysis-inducing protein, partial [Acidobacteriota bacterium]|nr:dispase autolysis-inducing protein [Acidobacteriota bacterium]
IDRDAEVTIRNQPVMKAHPTDPDVLYFVFGTYFQGYGTDLFRFDVKSKKLDKTHNDYNDIDSIEFSRTDPSTMYLGLEVEQVQ